MAPPDEEACANGLQSCSATRTVVVAQAGDGTEFRTYVHMSWYHMDTNLSQQHRTLRRHGASAVGMCLATRRPEMIMDIGTHGDEVD